MKRNQGYPQFLFILETTLTLVIYPDVWCFVILAPPSADQDIMINSAAEMTAIRSMTDDEEAFVTRMLSMRRMRRLIEDARDVSIAEVDKVGREAFALAALEIGAELHELADFAEEVSCYFASTGR